MDLKQYWNLSRDFEKYSKEYKLKKIKVIEDKLMGTFCNVYEKEDKVYINFKGTELKFNDILTDALYFKSIIPFKLSKPHILAHFGFVNQYMAIRKELHKVVKKLYENKYFYIFGHSLGGALSTLCAFDLDDTFTANSEDYIPKIQIEEIITFGTPRVGNIGFKEEYNKIFGNRHLNIRVRNDFVTKIPIIGYFHVGKSLILKGIKWYWSIAEHLNYGNYL
jgi:predicted lipase